MTWEKAALDARHMDRVIINEARCAPKDDDDWPSPENDTFRGEAESLLDNLSLGDVFVLVGGRRWPTGYPMSENEALGLSRALGHLVMEREYAPAQQDRQP